MSRIEHVNITVADPDATAALLMGLFDWTVRWSGAAINGGYTVHVGAADSYVALYSPAQDTRVSAENRYHTLNGLNHVGVVVEDLDAVERRVKDAGFTPVNHADYEPGRRFYFDGPDGVEYEVISYP